MRNARSAALGGRNWRSLFFTVFGRGSRSLLTPVAARLLPDIVRSLFTSLDSPLLGPLPSHARSQFEELPTFIYAQCHTVGFVGCSKFRSVGRLWVDPVQEAAAPGGRPDCIRTYGYVGHSW
jgi:hypothetical protein